MVIVLDHLRSHSLCTNTCISSQDGHVVVLRREYLKEFEKDALDDNGLVQREELLLTHPVYPQYWSMKTV